MAEAQAFKREGKWCVIAKAQVDSSDGGFEGRSANRLKRLDRLGLQQLEQVLKALDS